MSNWTMSIEMNAIGSAVLVNGTGGEGRATPGRHFAMKNSHQQFRATVTPGGTMTTLASPGIGGAESLAMWRVSMTSEQSGPEHVIDTEQLWLLQSGRAVVDHGGLSSELVDGEALVIPGGVTRKVRALSDSVFVVSGFSSAVATMPSAPDHVISPPWLR